jgi:tRNA 2-selenouridine synthase
VSSVVRELLVDHYDPVYLQSMKRNFAQYPTRTSIAPTNRSVEAMHRLAREMLLIK